MSTLSIDADIKVTRQDGHSAYSPGTTEELAIIAIDLLVKELGGEAAHQFIGQVLERYGIDTPFHAETLSQPRQTGTEKVEDALGVTIFDPKDVGRQS